MFHDSPFSLFCLRQHCLSRPDIADNLIICVGTFFKCFKLFRDKIPFPHKIFKEIDLHLQGRNWRFFIENTKYFKLISSLSPRIPFSVKNIFPNIEQYCFRCVHDGVMSLISSQSGKDVSQACTCADLTPPSSLLLSDVGLRKFRFSVLENLCEN